MSTIKKIAYDIRQIYKDWSDDSDITQEYLYYQINIARALLIQQKFSSRANLIPNKLKQQFYHDLELTESNEFVSGLGSILRTVNPIEPPLESYNFLTSIRVTSGSYTDINFTFVLPERFAFCGRNKWMQSQIFVTLGSDKRLYFTSANEKVKMMDRVKLVYVTEDPENAYPTSIDYDVAVPFEETEYPLEENMITALTDLIIKKITMSYQVKEDTTNDSASNE